MQVLTWLQDGAGTIQCADGHIHLRGVTDRERTEAAVRRIVDDATRLPAPSAYFYAALGRAGAVLSDLNRGIMAFGDVPADWLARYELASTPPHQSDEEQAPAPPDSYPDFSDDDLRQLAAGDGIADTETLSRAELIAALEAKNSSDQGSQNPAGDQS